MAVPRFLTVIANGTRKLVDAAITVSAGVADANKIPALDESGRLNQSFMPIGIGADTKILPATENLSAGNQVNVYNNAGVASVRKADGTTQGKECHGFVLEAVNSGQSATVHFEGTNTQCTGLTPGLAYFLGTTAGGIVPESGSPNATGNVLQRVGTAITETELSFEPGEIILIG